VTKILVLTDNLELKQFLENLVQKEKFKTFAFKFYFSSANKRLKPTQRFRRIDLKKKDLWVIQNYQMAISLHSKQIFPETIVKAIPCINIHPGFNPHNRGWYPQVFSILNGKPVGATIHVMDDQIDHGPILVQEKVQILEADTSASLYGKILEKEKELLEKNLLRVLNQSIQPKKPRREGNYNSIRSFQKCLRINLSKKQTVFQTLKYLRAMTHPPFWNCYYLD